MTQIANVFTYNEQFTPAQVGQGATLVLWTDRHAYTVIAVSASGKTATLQRDKAVHDKSKRGGMGHQNWLVTPDPGGVTIIARLGKKGWRSGGSKVLMGVRDEHYDWSF